MGVLMRLAIGDGSTQAYTMPNNYYTGDRVLEGNDLTTAVPVEPQNPMYIYKVSGGTATRLVLTTDYTYSAPTLTLNTAPAPGVSIICGSMPAVYQNATLKTEGVDYTFSGSNVITFAVAPAAGDLIQWDGQTYDRG